MDFRLYRDRNRDTVNAWEMPIVCGWNSPVLCPGTALLNVVDSRDTDWPDESVAPYYRAIDGKYVVDDAPGALSLLEAGLAVIIEREEFAWVEEKQLREVRERLRISTPAGAEARTFLIWEIPPARLMFSGFGAAEDGYFNAIIDRYFNRPRFGVLADVDYGCAYNCLAFLHFWTIGYANNRLAQNDDQPSMMMPPDPDPDDPPPWDIRHGWTSADPTYGVEINGGMPMEGIMTELALGQKTRADGGEEEDLPQGERRQHRIKSRWNDRMLNPDNLRTLTVIDWHRVTNFYYRYFAVNTIFQMLWATMNAMNKRVNPSRAEDRPQCMMVVRFRKALPRVVDGTEDDEQPEYVRYPVPDTDRRYPDKDRGLRVQWKAGRRGPWVDADIIGQARSRGGRRWDHKYDLWIPNEAGNNIGGRAVYGVDVNKLRGKPICDLSAWGHAVIYFTEYDAGGVRDGGAAGSSSLYQIDPQPRVRKSNWVVTIRPQGDIKSVRYIAKTWGAIEIMQYLGRGGEAGGGPRHYEPDRFDLRGAAAWRPRQRPGTGPDAAPPPAADGGYGAGGADGGGAECHEILCNNNEDCRYHGCHRCAGSRRCTNVPHPGRAQQHDEDGDDSDEDWEPSDGSGDGSGDESSDVDVQQLAMKERRRRRKYATRLRPRDCHEIQCYNDEDCHDNNCNRCARSGRCTNQAIGGGVCYKKSKRKTKKKKRRRRKKTKKKKSKKLNRKTRRRRRRKRKSRKNKKHIYRRMSTQKGKKRGKMGGQSRPSPPPPAAGAAQKSSAKKAPKLYTRITLDLATGKRTVEKVKTLGGVIARKNLPPVYPPQTEKERAAEERKDADGRARWKKFFKKNGPIQYPFTTNQSKPKNQKIQKKDTAEKKKD